MRPVGIYRLFNLLGHIADIFISRGNLSEENQKIYDEVARSLKIEHRGIKAQNMGLLPRIGMGYANAFAASQLNRTYFNEDWLNELTDEQKKFLMGTNLLITTGTIYGHVWLFLDC